MAASTALVTVEEFRKLEDPPGVRLELHNGEVVEVTWPKHKHWRIQQRLTKVFREALGAEGEAGPKFGFRPLPEHELRVADVAWVSRDRYDAIDDEDNLHGAPETVVEVLSPSNTVSEMVEKRDVCFSAGCREFWIVDPRKRFIEVTPFDGVPHVYRGSERISIGDRTYSVDEILGNGGRQ
jgi:Uma2 family endonuclease